MKITLLTGKIFEIENGTDLPLRAVSSAVCRRLSLRIDNKERKVVLNLPPRCSARKALDFVEKNRDWIEAHLLAVPMSRQFSDGDEISFFGENLKICHCPEAKSDVVREGNMLKVSGEKEFLSRRVCDFIRNETHLKMRDLSRQKAARIGCRVNRVTIKDTKSRWGSCSTLNNINYNWRIALAPVEAIDYLAAHEVAHLKYQDHSAVFWECVRSLSPYAESGRCWLKQNGRLLYAYE